jgi:hypothetical protein
MSMSPPHSGRLMKQSTSLADLGSTTSPITGRRPWSGTLTMRPTAAAMSARALASVKPMTGANWRLAQLRVDRRRLTGRFCS